MRKLSAETRREIAVRLLKQDYDLQVELAKELGIAEPTVSQYKRRLRESLGDDIFDDHSENRGREDDGPTMAELALEQATKTGQQSPNGMFGSGALKRILRDMHGWDAKSASNAMYRAIKDNPDFEQIAAGTWQYVGDPPQQDGEEEAHESEAGYDDGDADADETASTSLTETPLKPPNKDAYMSASQAAQNHEFGSPPWSDDLFEGNDVVCYCVGHGKFDDAIAYSRDGMVIAVRQAKPGDVVVARVLDVKPTIAITEAREHLREWGADDE